MAKGSKTGDHKPRDMGVFMIYFYFVCFCSIDYLVYILNVLGTDLCNYIYLFVY